MLGNHRIRIALISALLLLVPLVGNFTSDEVNWSASDFLIAFVLLYGMGLIIHILWNRLRHHKARYWVIAGIILLFLLLWTELAVGIFGSPIAGS